MKIRHAITDKEGKEITSFERKGKAIYYVDRHLDRINYEVKEQEYIDGEWIDTGSKANF